VVLACQLAYLLSRLR